MSDRPSAVSPVPPEPPDPCTEQCWTAVPCPECGSDLPPRGRSVPLAMGMADCCERNRYSNANKRHLWDARDEERWRFDPPPEPPDPTLPPEAEGFEWAMGWWALGPLKPPTEAKT